MAKAAVWTKAQSLVLFFDGKTVYGAIGRLEISVGLKENMEQKLV